MESYRRNLPDEMDAAGDHFIHSHRAREDDMAAE
jgi:hypothetical protein